MSVDKLFYGVDRYVTAGAAWLNGAFGKVAKAGQAAGTKTREKFHMAVSNLTAKVGYVAIRITLLLLLHLYCMIFYFLVIM